VVHWLIREPRSEKLNVAATAAVGLVLTLVFITIAAKLHNDPRPFVQNPHLHPLIAHSADNGFPSDHSAAAGLITTLIALRDRLLGAALGVCAIVVAAARVAAHIHHVQDVVAGLALGVLAALIATALLKVIARRVPALR
jgi:undecaprenyl-diphosphatase